MEKTKNFFVLVGKKIKSLFWGDEKMGVLSPLFLVLVTISTVSLLLSNILAGKSFSLFGWSIGNASLVLTCGVLLYPITYIISDLMSECYGFSASRRVTWLGFGMNLFMIIFVILGIIIPSANPYYEGISNGLKVGFGLDFLDGGAGLGSLGILFASLIAFTLGSWVDDLVFQAFKVKHKEKDSKAKFVFRAVFSSLTGEIVDSIIFIPLLYYFTSQMGTTITSFWQIVAIILIQAFVKTLYELVVSPLTAVLAKKIKSYEANYKMRLLNQ